VPGKDDEPKDEVPAVLREEPAPRERKASLVPAAAIVAGGMFAGFAWKFKKTAA
jgi:hypothetical protein